MPRKYNEGVACLR